MHLLIEQCAGLTPLSCEAGTVLIREGDAGHGLIVLAEGEVEVLKGEVEVARSRTPGALFGEMSALLGMPFSATVRARTPVSYYRIDDAEAFLNARPEVSLHTARLLAQRLHAATAYLADIQRQFQDRSDHLGMIDQVLGSLLNAQAQRGGAREERRDDPRL